MTTKEDVEDASGEGEQERWFEEKDAMNRARWRVGVTCRKIADKFKVG